MKLTDAEQQRIVRAIQEVEQQTSGEIKVHVEEACPAGDALERAREIFTFLALDKTALRNGVLIYLAWGDRKFAILGDAGIDKHVTSVFWDSTKQLLQNYFAKDLIADGLCAGVTEAGKQLRRYFPSQGSDINELSDDISFG